MLVRARIDFKKPSFDELQDKGFTYVDTHYHTKYSDGIRSVPTVAKKLRKLKMGVSITDHNDIRGAVEISEYKDILSIPGIEVTSKEGIHTLLYFYDVDEIIRYYMEGVLPFKNKTNFLNIGIADQLQMAKDFQCVVAAAHPYGIAWTGLCKMVHRNTVDTDMVKSMHAIEVINGANQHSRNKRAVLLAENLDKPIVGGSDGHSLKELGKVVTYSFADDRESFLRSILNKKSHVIGKESHILTKAREQSVKITVPTSGPASYLSKGYHYIRNRNGNK